MAEQANQALPVGYQLLGYRIAKQLSGGGFSLVYLAYDEYGSPVAIKEYLPSALAVRKEGATVTVRSAEDLAVFRNGMKCFFEEGRTLASISHPNVVKVLNFFRANETVYMVMQYERGRTLQELIRTRGGAMSEAFVRRVFVELLNGLREVHARKLLHFDIKPANIYIRLDESPLLLDFGAARQALANDRPKLSPMYTPGFAAPEQYYDRANLGPWTDIYSIGASMFACLAGQSPPSADERLRSNKLLSAKKSCPAHYSDRLLEIVDWCLELEYRDRPQSVFALQKALLEKTPEPDGKPSLLHSIRATIARIGNR